MFIVYNKSTGFSDESMRYAERSEAVQRADALEDMTGEEHGIRHEA